MALKGGWNLTLTSDKRTVIDMAEEPNVTQENGTVDGSNQPDGQEPTGNGEVTFTPEQQEKLNEIINKTVAKERKNAISQDDLAQIITDERTKWQAEQEEAAKVAKMSETQKQQYEAKQRAEELAQARAEAESLRNELTRNTMTAEASKMLAEKGVTPDERTLGFVVRDTADETTKAIEDFTDLVNSKAEALRQNTLTGKTPSNRGSQSFKTYSKADFMKLPVGEQMAFKRNNPEAYAQIIGR